jgi:hypothetical protein
MAILDAKGKPFFGPDPDCRHTGAAVEYDPEKARGLDAHEVRKLYPRFSGRCPDCGCQLIKYASTEHYVMGDW